MSTLLWSMYNYNLSIDLLLLLLWVTPIYTYLQTNNKDKSMTNILTISFIFYFSVLMYFYNYHNPLSLVAILYLVVLVALITLPFHQQNFTLDQYTNIVSTLGIIFPSFLLADPDLLIFFINVELLSLIYIYLLLFSNKDASSVRNTLIAYILLSSIYLFLFLVLFVYLSICYHTTNICVLAVLGISKDFLPYLATIAMVLVKISLLPFLLWARGVYINLSWSGVILYTYFNLCVVFSHLSILKSLSFSTLKSPTLSILLVLLLLISLIQIFNRPKTLKDLFLISTLSFSLFLTLVF